MGTGLTVFPQDALGYTIQAIYPHKSAVVTSAVANAQYQIGSQCKAVRLENKDATNEIVLTFGDDPDAATGAKFVGDTEPCRLRLSPGVIEIFAVKPGSKIGYIRSGGAGTEAELEIIEAGNQDSGTPQ